MQRDWFPQRSGQWSRGRAPGHRARRSRALWTEIESLEGRALLSATSAVAWTAGGVTHSALYAIDQNDAVEVSIDGGSFTNLGGYAKQVSAGLDAFNKPEVYAIGADDAVYVNKGSGWVSLGGYLKAISATVENTIYAIGTDDDIYLSHGTPGLGWFNTGLKARQISAGTDAIGNPEVYAIGFNNNVYAGNGSGGPAGFADWGGYAKQISATIGATVYAIGADNAVYKDHGSGGGTGWVSLGGYAKQISAGIDGTFSPYVFAIGLNDGLWANHGSGWVSLGGYVTDVSGPSIASFGVSLPADLAYAVAEGHGGLLHQGTSFVSLGGYIQTPSGSTTNNTDSWEPASRDTSAISWASGGVTHSALYIIGPNDNVEVSVDGGSFTNLGGYAKQVSAGLDAFNKPEVYAIGADDAVYVNKGSGWVSLGGYLKAISATVENTVYAIGTNDDIFVGHGTPGLGWTDTGLKARQISAGTDAIGNPEVYAIGFDDAVYAGNGSGGPAGFADWGGYAKQISATIGATVYAIGADNAVYENHGSGSGTGWVSLGGYAKQISAGIASAFPQANPYVFAIGLNDGLWSNAGSGWVSLGGYVTELSGPTAGNAGISLPANLVYVVGKGHGGFLHNGTTFTSIGGGSIE
jgi:Tectonin domain